MQGRKYSADKSYRYGFNGKENDNEVKGEGNQQDYGMRINDPRLGRFLSIDPLFKSFPWYTSYQFAGNTPIQAIDLDGEEEKHYTLTLNKNGSATLTNIPSQTKEYNEIPLWLRIITLGAGKSKYKIQPRAVVTYGSNTYKIGFASSVTNLDKMDQFNEILKNPNSVDPDAFTSSFHDENKDLSVALFTFNVNLQNNAFMYGNPFSKAWYTPEEKSSVGTPYKTAFQSLSNKALDAVESIKNGASLYRIGTKGVSKIGNDAQFWSLENPLTNPEAFAKKYGVPVANIKNADFIEIAKIKPGANFITREAPTAPGAPKGAGGGIEAVIAPGGTTGNVIKQIKK